jgi:putative oxidoreductase
MMDAEISLKEGGGVGGGRREWVVRVLCWLFGGLFVYAGVVKVADPLKFLDDVRSFALLPDPLAAWLVLFLPWFELLAGLAVVIGVGRAGGLWALNALLLVFLVVILRSWGSGLDITCGCFGGTGESDYVELVLWDLVLLGLGLGALVGSGAGGGWPGGAEVSGVAES